MNEALGRESIRLRVEEYGKIWMLLRMFMESEDPLTVIVIIWGGPGTGKTTVARKLMDNAKHAWKNLEQIYLDPEAAGYQGLFSALQHACGLRGYSGLEILSLLRNRFLIVIDNVEIFSSEDKQVSTVLRISEAFPRGSFFILLIFRSDSIPVDISRVPPPAYIIYFKPYTFEEIRTILMEFLGGHEGFSVDKQALNTVSRIASFSGDARLALSILKTSLNTSKDKHVDEKHVLKVLRELADNPLECMNANLSDVHERLILKIVSEHSSKIRLKNLFEEYRIIAKENGIKPLGYTQLWKRIKILENKMLLDFKVLSFKGGRTGVVWRKDLNWAMRL
ncbi:MAG: AAA family ATPase [Thermoproteota archaeon]